MDRLLAVGPGTLVTSVALGAIEAPTGGFLVLVAVLLVGGGAVLLWRRRDDDSTARPAEPIPDADIVTPGDGSTPGPDAPSGETVVSDEDRVVALLRDNDGRMRQSDIVERTNWSKSKVSVLLSEMDDDDEINKLRLGRENIISLPGHEPEATRSPHDE